MDDYDYGYDYYDSPEWQEERERALFNWDGTCERCGCETGSPHVHHVYGLGSSVYEILCPECHAEHHGNPEIASFGSSDYEPKCKYCGKRIEWGKTEGGKWVPMEPGYTNFHKCKKRFKR